MGRKVDSPKPSGPRGAPPLCTPPCHLSTTLSLPPPTSGLPSPSPSWCHHNPCTSCNSLGPGGKASCSTSTLTLLVAEQDCCYKRPRVIGDTKGLPGREDPSLDKEGILIIHSGPFPCPGAPLPPRQKWNTSHCSRCMQSNHSCLTACSSTTLVLQREKLKVPPRQQFQLHLIQGPQQLQSPESSHHLLLQWAQLHRGA